MAEGDKVILMTGSSCASCLVSESGDEFAISGNSAMSGDASSCGGGATENRIGLGPISSTVLSFILRANSVIAGESVSLNGWQGESGAAVGLLSSTNSSVFSSVRRSKLPKRILCRF